MKYYLKQSLIPFIYLFFCSLTAVAVLFMVIEPWIKNVFLTLNLALYAYLVGVMSFKDGQDAVKIRNANDLNRKIIIETGEDRPLKIHEEYKPLKGFLFGGIVCVPLLLLLLIHTLLTLIGGPHLNGAGAIGYFAYFMFSSYLWTGGLATVLPWHYYFLLVSVPFFCCCTGIPYYMGARKVLLQQERIERQHKYIYGDKK